MILTAPHEAIYSFTIYFAIPFLVLAVSYFLLLRKRNWLDHVAFIIAIYWLIKVGIDFYSSNISLPIIFGQFGNVFALLWFLGYIVSKKMISRVIHQKEREAYATFLIFAGSLALFAVFFWIYLGLGFAMGRFHL
jgi:hypothetical protein